MSTLPSCDSYVESTVSALSRATSPRGEETRNSSSSKAIRSFCVEPNVDGFVRPRRQPQNLTSRTTSNRDEPFEISAVFGFRPSGAGKSPNDSEVLFCFAVRVPVWRGIPPFILRSARTQRAAATMERFLGCAPHNSPALIHFVYASAANTTLAGSAALSKTHF